jgi:hypothetical protein
MPSQQSPIREAVEAIMSLRRAERHAGARAREDIASAREFLEQLVGLTVRPADAARLLGVSRPALKKWIDKGEISTVLTPKGRREVPFAELLDLLEEVAEHRRNGSARPLSAVIRDRTRRSTETIDIDRLLPRKRPRGHRAAELHALAYHRVVAERLSDEMLDDARRRLRRWETSGRIDRRWAAEWARVLALPRSRVAKAISADTPRARELRQTSPFAGALSEQERRRLVQLVEERASA